MGPVIVMILGIVCFVILFGTGAIWFVIEHEKPMQIVTLSDRKTALNAELSVEDRQYRLDARAFALNECSELLQAFWAVLQIPTSIEWAGKKDYSKVFNDAAGSGSLAGGWNSLYAYANQNLEQIDPDVLSEKIISFLCDYKSLNVLAYVVVTRDTKSNLVSTWLAKDAAAKTAFIRLRTRTSKYLQDDSLNSLFADHALFTL